MKVFLLIVVMSIVCLQILPYAYSDTNSVVGEWEVTSQSPTQKELMIISMKAMGMQDVNPDEVTFVEQSQQVIITEKSIKWESMGAGMGGSIESPCRIEGDKIKMIIEGEKSDALTNHINQFTPQHYVFKFEDGNLVLTTSEISGYENRTIIYKLKRIE